MNSPTEIYSRVLRLFPVSVIKDHFQKAKKSQDALIAEVMKTASPGDVERFVNANISYTRQHLYVFDLEKPANFNPAFLPAGFSCGDSAIAGFTMHTFLVPIRSTVIEFNAMRKSDIDNLWPVSVWIGKKHAVISLTILERYLRYFQDKSINVIGQSITEDQLVTQILQAFHDARAKVSFTDTQKGIKHLMQHDVLDLRLVTSKNSRSVRTEVMDKGYTLKATYPAEFNEIMHRPLEKAVFRFVPDFQQIEDFPDKFTCEPQTGIFSIIKYSPKLDSVAETVNLILSNN